ncbi:cytidylate kinase [Candidatus Endolissoclinum faulkneri L5]|uniref:Cytidylate kinase n=1 Tax=Candidatus Endolissoclinum faulkneri L5 TaxID=1401328 RepID=V9TTM5_9PROT|nr:(d)CMP kinase [Candidatus Endolissoclinum faulkneri]AHC73956.1 cytidylate kinase [Candidatus Endolissoclinum faulkneri L5]
MIIAIDGPAGAGKGTLSRSLAAYLGYPYLDTGTLYRAAALYLIKNGGALDDPTVIKATVESVAVDIIDDDNLRTSEIALASSKIAKIPAVREALLEFQQKFAHRSPGAILDGRDVTTVIAPEADVKLFVTALLEVRALRRHQELLDRDQVSIYAKVLAEIKARDEQDKHRISAPMRKADDAIEIDTSDLKPLDVFRIALTVISEVAKGKFSMPKLLINK